MRKRRLIETDGFPIEFLSLVAERESWRKEIHRPIYHVHKWWAKRLGSIFRGILLGCAFSEDDDLVGAFPGQHDLRGVVLDPFMGSGTTVGEAHKLGLTALGRDINPVAVRAVRTALGPMDKGRLREAMCQLRITVGEELIDLYRSEDEAGHACDVLYYFWVMQANCPGCTSAVDLFSSYVIARNAYPDRKPETQVVCPGCGEVFPSQNGKQRERCPSCSATFAPADGTARGAAATCQACGRGFRILDAFAGRSTPPMFRLYAKLVLTEGDTKRYIRVSQEDAARYARAAAKLHQAETSGALTIPSAALAPGNNTNQAMGYGFTSWRHFFNDRQLLALASLRNAIDQLSDVSTRDAFLTLFSGLLEFNNLFASYKGEGTGAVRHMFSHHILKPERTPIEANVWGTTRSSGSFSGLYRSRLLRALEYRNAPTEVTLGDQSKRVSSRAFSGVLAPWTTGPLNEPRAISLSCGDSSDTSLRDECIDYVVTDPPFFDNVHYSELADFFYAWQEAPRSTVSTTRSEAEVQDTDPGRFASKLSAVFSECRRVLRKDGLLVFSYHHSRDDGWESVAAAIIDAGFSVVNVHPVKAEMSVATPKSQAKSPIQLDVVIVCRKGRRRPITSAEALTSGEEKVRRLERAGFSLSMNDVRVTFLGQMLRVARTAEEFPGLQLMVDKSILERTPEGRVTSSVAQARTLELFPIQERVRTSRARRGSETPLTRGAKP